MNDDRKFQEKKSQLLEVLGLGMSAVVIMETLEISQSTLANYFSRVVATREYEDTKIVSLKEAKPKMLLLFAQLTIAPQKVLYGGNKNKLKEALANVLEEQKILEVLSYSLPHIMSFSQPQFADDVPKPYQNLIKDFFGQERKRIEQIVWKDFLSKVTQYETPLLSVESFNWGSNHFIHEIIASYVEEIRKYFAATYTKEIVSVIDKAMLGLPDRDCAILNWTYGFFGEKKSYEEIGLIEHRTKARIGQIVSSTKMNFKSRLRDKLFLSTWQENYLLKIHHQGELERTERLFKEAMLPPSEESNVDVEDYAKLLLPITSFEISIRVENSFKADQIKYLWEMLILTREQMQKVRNFGKKSVDEVEQLAHTLGYKLGVDFLPAEIAYFKVMTYGQEPRKRY